MTIQPLTGILMAAALTETLVVMVGWHVMTRGVWTTFPAGRVLMALLGVMGAILALAAASSFFPYFPGRAWVYIILYAVLVCVLACLGWTIFREQRNRD